MKLLRRLRVGRRSFLALCTCVGLAVALTTVLAQCLVWFWFVPLGLEHGRQLLIVRARIESGSTSLPLTRATSSQVATDLRRSGAAAVTAFANGGATVSSQMGKSNHSILFVDEFFAGLFDTANVTKYRSLHNKESCVAFVARELSIRQPAWLEESRVNIGALDCLVAGEVTISPFFVARPDFIVSDRHFQSILGQRAASSRAFTLAVHLGVGGSPGLHAQALTSLLLNDESATDVDVKPLSVHVFGALAAGSIKWAAIAIASILILSAMCGLAFALVSWSTDALEWQIKAALGARATSLLFEMGMRATTVSAVGLSSGWAVAIWGMDLITEWMSALRLPHQEVSGYAWGAGALVALAFLLSVLASGAHLFRGVLAPGTQRVTRWATGLSAAICLTGMSASFIGLPTLTTLGARVREVSHYRWSSVWVAELPEVPGLTNAQVLQYAEDRANEKRWIQEVGLLSHLVTGRTPQELPLVNLESGQRSPLTHLVATYNVSGAALSVLGVTIDSTPDRIGRRCWSSERVVADLAVSRGVALGARGPMRRGTFEMLFECRSSGTVRSLPFRDPITGERNERQLAVELEGNAQALRFLVIRTRDAGPVTTGDVSTLSLAGPPKWIQRGSELLSASVAWEAMVSKIGALGVLFLLATTTVFPVGVAFQAAAEAEHSILVRYALGGSRWQLLKDVAGRHIVIHGAAAALSVAVALLVEPAALSETWIPSLGLLAGGSLGLHFLAWWRNISVLVRRSGRIMSLTAAH